MPGGLDVFMDGFDVAAQAFRFCSQDRCVFEFIFEFLVGKSIIFHIRYCLSQGKRGSPRVFFIPGTGTEACVTAEEMCADHFALFRGEVSFVFDGEVGGAVICSNRTGFGIDALIRTGIDAACAAAAAIPGVRFVRFYGKTQQDLTKKQR